MNQPDPVTAAYDRIADQWTADRQALAKKFRERTLIDALIAPLKAHATILDVGCGAGEPIMAYLVNKGFEVTGLDGSHAMLRLAKKALPSAAFVLGDMRTATVEGRFDAIVAWDSLFHLPREQHASMFVRFYGWLGPNGRLLVSLGGAGDPGFTSQMHGQTFFYSGYDPAESLKVIESAGFRVEHWEVDDPSGRGHIAVMAERI